MNKTRAFVVLIAAGSLASCAPDTSVRKAATRAAAAPSMAIVYGTGGGMGGFLKGVLLPLGARKKLRLNIINGQPADEIPDSDPVAYLVPQGEHLLGVSCTIQVDSQLFHGSGEIKLRAEAGREYALDAVLAESRCVFNQPCTVCKPKVALVPAQ